MAYGRKARSRTQAGHNKPLSTAPAKPAEPEKCGGCHRLEPGAGTPVTLCDGRTVCTWCRDWMIECRDRHAEAVDLLRLPTLEARRNRLNLVESERGAVFRQRLEVEVRRLWNLRLTAVGLAPDTTEARE